MKLKVRADTKDVIIFLIFCVVLLYLVAIAVVNLNSFAVDGVFLGLNPIPAFVDFFWPTLIIYFVILVALMLTCSSYFFEMEEGIGFTSEKKSKSDGYSKLMTEKEMKKDRGIAKVHLKDDTYEAGGIPIINNGVDAWVDAKGEPHALIMGASGSGKTQAFMFPLIKILGRAGESMIVTDPKGELYEACGNLLKEKGYKLILVNFRDPKEGAAWNPFSYPYRIYKEGNADKANELLQDLASNILIDPNNKAEPFWEQTASNFFTGLSLGLFDDAPESEININSINMMAEVGEDRIGSSNYIKEYFKSKGELSPAYIAAASCINAPSETRGGIMSTFRTKTRIFSSQAGLSEMLSYSDFDIRDIGKEKTAVFLKVHDEKTTYHALATIFVKQVYEALIAVAQTCPNLKLPYRTNFILDEFANMPALKDVETMITASRSRNIRFTFVIQNFSQLNKVYGKDVAETIKGNCGNFVYIMSTELAALEEVSKLLGDQKPEKSKKDEPAKPIRPLFTVSDLQALKEGEVIVNRFRSMPFKSKLVYDYKIDWGKKYEPMGYSERPHREVEVFDIKAFVNKLREEQGMPSGMGMGMAPGMGMMGAFPGMPIGSASMNNPFISTQESIGPVPGGRKSAGVVPTSLDDYVRRLDEKIAELEREEAEENARIERERKEQASKLTEKIENTAEKLEEKIDDTSNRIEEVEDKIDETSDKINDSIEEKQESIDDKLEAFANRYEEATNKNVESEEDIKSDIEDILNHRTSNESVSAPLYTYNEEDDDDDEIIPDVIEIEPEEQTIVTEPVSVEAYTEPVTEVKTEYFFEIQTEPETKPIEIFRPEIITEAPVAQIIPNEGYVQQPTYAKVSKPVVNVDVDSIVVNDNNEQNNEDFFDDFFGSEDE